MAGSAAGVEKRFTDFSGKRRAICVRTRFWMGACVLRKREERDRGKEGDRDALFFGGLTEEETAAEETAGSIGGDGPGTCVWARRGCSAIWRGCPMGSSDKCENRGGNGKPVEDSAASIGDGTGIYCQTPLTGACSGSRFLRVGFRVVCAKRAPMRRSRQDTETGCNPRAARDSTGIA